MKVTVIGCSTSWTDKPVSSYCVNNNILVDCGEGTTKYYKKCGVDFYNINHVFITHMHSDHFVGLSAHISQVLAYEDDSQKFRLNIYGPKGLLKALVCLKEMFACPSIKKNIEDYINIVEVTPNQTINVEGLEVKPFLLKHGDMQDIGYVFSDDKTSVGFSGDCTYTEGVKDFVEPCKVAFIDCCAEHTSKNHMGADKFNYLQQIFPQKRLIAVHCTDEFLQVAKDLNIETTESGKKYSF